MKILMVNNRLKVYGGEGTYMTSIGDELIRRGHDVQYFGLKDDNNLHGNRFGIYAKKSKNPFSILKNRFNRRQFAKILDEFHPDVVHINLIYFTLTPSILVEAKKRNIKIVQTVHDGKIICPSYQLYVSSRNEPCDVCKNGNFKNCIKNKCHKNSYFLSYLAYKEASYNRKHAYYDLVDKFIFPSFFMQKLHLEFGIPHEKTVVLKNFSRIERNERLIVKEKKYVLFFGRVTKVKGISLILHAANVLPDVNFKIVGTGEMIDVLRNHKNIEILGFKEGKELEDIISNATVSVFPSVWFENCPMSIQESIALGTPVIGSNLGGIPELIQKNVTGLIFEPNNIDQFVKCIKTIYFDEVFAKELSNNCLSSSNIVDLNGYCELFLKEIK